MSDHPSQLDSPTHQLDARGLHCPLPLLRLRQALHRMQLGETIQLIASDPNSQTDIRRYCERAGQHLLAAWQSEDQTYFGFDIEKTAP
ncbi:MAG: sulfurtransferase TusA family protein [Pseudomonadota bacterium]|nr:sulfurtransferase TusA family protein [Pseudomonadota bacterium]